MKLFDFQSELVDAGNKLCQKYKRVILQLMTAGGKTFCIAEITRRALLKGNNVCIGVHRIEIFHQVVKTLRLFGIDACPIVAGHNPMPGHQVYVAMVETFSRRQQKGLTKKLNINLFILDEIHIGNYYKMVKEIECYVVGFTATPKSTGKPELAEYFEAIHCGPSIRELVDLGRLVPAKTYSIKHDFSGLKITRGDYDRGALEEEWSKPKLRLGAFKEWEKHSKDKQTLAYSVSVDKSLDLCEQFRQAGYIASHVDGNTPASQREAIFNAYKKRTVQIICNVGVATTGTDLPDTQCIVKNYATISLVKDVQVSGRGARSSEGKKSFDIIDMGRNWIRHGKFGEHVDWESIFNNPTEATRKNELKVNRECDECGAVIKFKLRMCPYCQNIITEKELELKILEGASTEEIKEYRLSSLPVNLRKKPKDMNYGELTQFAEYMGYNPKWVHKMRNVWKRH